jgi:hypothetical protein
MLLNVELLSMILTAGAIPKGALPHREEKGVSISEFRFQISDFG